MQCQREEWNQEEKDWSVEYMSLNWDYEIISEQTVLDLSYRTVKEILRNDVKMIGFQEAFRKALTNFDIATNQLKNVDEKNVTEKCDSSFRILMSTYTAMSDVLGDEIKSVYIYLLGAMINIKKWDSKNIENIYLLEEKSIRGAIYLLKMFNDGYSQAQVENELAIRRQNSKDSDLWFGCFLLYDVKKENVNRDIKYCMFLLNALHNKSLIRLFIESMDYIIQIYCKRQKQNVEKVRKRIFNEAYNFLGGVMEKDAIGSAFQAFDNQVFNRREKFDNPFKYYEEHGFLWRWGKK